MSMAKGILEDTHPLSAAAARSFALANADVVMLVGARLNWLLAHGKKGWAADTQYARYAGRIETKHIYDSTGVA